MSAIGIAPTEWSFQENILMKVNLNKSSKYDLQVVSYYYSCQQFQRIINTKLCGKTVSKGNGPKMIQFVHNKVDEKLHFCRKMKIILTVTLWYNIAFSLVHNTELTKQLFELEKTHTITDLKTIINFLGSER